MQTKLMILKFGLKILLFTFCGIMYSQNVSIKGTVTSDGQPLPGVTVLVKGTTTGTATDFDGAYELSVSRFKSLLPV